eukprot:3562810-Rhodomonas_salina.1
MSMYDEAPSAAKRYWRDSAQRAKEIENVFRFSKIFELESELLAVVRELADHGHIELIGALPKKISPTVEKWGCFIKTLLSLQSSASTIIKIGIDERFEHTALLAFGCWPALPLFLCTIHALVFLTQ